MPGVLMIEALAQARRCCPSSRSTPDPTTIPWYYFAGIDNARFKRPVEPATSWCSTSTLERAKRRSTSSKARALVGDELAVEADLMCTMRRIAGARIMASIHPPPSSSRRRARRERHVGPYATIGAHVRIGEGTSIGAHTVVEGRTTIGRDNRIFQFASIGAMPQDKKYAGEPTELIIGDATPSASSARSTCGTVQDGGVTRLGDDNWIMAYVHIAHDCRPAATPSSPTTPRSAATCTWATGRSSAGCRACTSSCASARMR